MASHNDNSRRGMGRTGFSTRDFNVVDQSVNLMDMGGGGGGGGGSGDNHYDAEDPQTTSHNKPRKNASSGITGLFRASQEHETLNRFDEYGDADVANDVDAEEYIDGRKRRYFVPYYSLSLSSLLSSSVRALWQHKKFVLTLAMAVTAAVLVIRSVGSFEEIEDEGGFEQNGYLPSSSSSSSDTGVVLENHFEGRYNAIKQLIVDASVTPPNVFDSEIKDMRNRNKNHKKNGIATSSTSTSTSTSHASPQQRALDWIVFEDTALLAVDDIALLDRYGLAVFYFSSTNSHLEGGKGGWWYTDHWMSGVGICNWHGVECVPESQDATEDNGYEPFTKTYDANHHATALRLSGNNIGMAQLPDELGTAFVELLTLDVDDNAIAGTLPAVFRQGHKLRELVVSKNELVGTIPQDYVTFRNLHVLNVADNRLTGPVWYESWSSALTKLRFVDASHNQLTGTFPDVARMTRMTGLLLVGNRLQGSLPESISTMTNLLDLHLSENNFSGPIGALSNLMNLESVHLANNQFTGTIPDMFDKLFRLHDFSVLHNQLTGTIPNTMTHLQVLKILNLDSNQLTGTLPPGFGLLTDVVTLSVRDNKFEGGIPTLLGQLDDIQILRLDGNKLQGLLPSSLGLCFRLAELHVHNNDLMGSIPVELGQLNGLKSFRLEGNHFTEGAEMPPQVCALRDDDLVELVADCSDAAQVSCACCTQCL